MMANLHDLLERVQEAGANLSVNGDKLRVRTTAPLPDELVNQLRQAKPQLLEYLRCNTWDAEDWQTLFQERITITEHDGDLSPEEAYVSGAQKFALCYSQCAFPLRCRVPA